MDFHTTIHNPQFVDRPGNARQISTALPFLHPLHWGTVRSDYTSYVYSNKRTPLTLPKATPECSSRCLAFHDELRRRRDLCVQFGHVHVKTPKNKRGHAMDMPICWYWGWSCRPWSVHRIQRQHSLRELAPKRLEPASHWRLWLTAGKHRCFRSTAAVWHGSAVEKKTNAT